MFPRVFGDKLGDEFGDKFSDEISDKFSESSMLVMNLMQKFSTYNVSSTL